MPVLVALSASDRRLDGEAAPLCYPRAAPLGQMQQGPRDLLITSWFLVGAFDEGAFLEPCACADQRDQVGCVERAPPGLCGLDELFDDLVAGGGWLRTRASSPSLRTANRPSSRQLS